MHFPWKQIFLKDILSNKNSSFIDIFQFFHKKNYNLQIWIHWLSDVQQGCMWEYLYNVKWKTLRYNTFLYVQEKVYSMLDTLGVAPKRVYICGLSAREKPCFSHYHVRVNNCLCSEEFILFWGSLVKSLIWIIFGCQSLLKDIFLFPNSIRQRAAPGFSTRE